MANVNGTEEIILHGVGLMKTHDSLVGGTLHGYKFHRELVLYFSEHEDLADDILARYKEQTGEDFDWRNDDFNKPEDMRGRRANTMPRGGNNGGRRA